MIHVSILGPRCLLRVFGDNWPCYDEISLNQALVINVLALIWCIVWGFHDNFVLWCQFLSLLWPYIFYWNWLHSKISFHLTFCVYLTYCEQWSKYPFRFHPNDGYTWSQVVIWKKVNDVLLQDRWYRHKLVAFYVLQYIVSWEVQ